MSHNIRVRWSVPNRVLLTSLPHEVTVQDVEDAATDAAQLIQQGQAPVHDIVDTRQLVKYPVKLPLLSQASSFLREENLGWAVLISTNTMAKFLSIGVTHFYHSQLKIVATPEEALIFLRKTDPSLPEFPPYEEVYLQ